MRLELYAHPFSSYCQKVLIALREKQVDFTYLHLEEGDNGARVKALWPIGKFPVLLADGAPIFETDAIVEYLDRRFPSPRLIPPDDDEAVEMRTMNSVFDSWVMQPMSAIVATALRGEEIATSPGVAAARASLENVYRWLDARLEGRSWAIGNAFTLADCTAAPALFYADWANPIPAELATLRGYRGRLLSRASIARAVDEGRRYRHYFPLDIPEPAEPLERPE